MEFAWDAPDQTVSVDAYRYTVTKSNSGQEAEYTENTGGLRSSTSSDLTPGGMYVIRVRAVNNDIESAPTDQLNVTLGESINTVNMPVLNIWRLFASIATRETDALS